MLLVSSFLFDCCTIHDCRQLLQAVYLAAKRKSEQLGESVEGYAVEATKLTERLVSAEAQYVDGMRKVKAASKQLQYLQKEVAGSEANAQSESGHPPCKHCCKAV